MRSFAWLTGFLLATTLSAAVDAQVAGVAIEKSLGDVKATRMVKLEGTIVAIDAATRVVGLRNAMGEETDVVAGPDVRNFARLRVGDTVSLEYLQQLRLQLLKGSTEEVSRTEEGAAARAEPGATPGGVHGRRVTIVAEVVALDKDKQVVTLKGVNGSLDLEIPDPAQFANIALKDRIRATYVEAVAVAVEPVTKEGATSE